MRQLKNIHDEVERATLAKIKDKVEKIKRNQINNTEHNISVHNGGKIY